MEVKAAVNSQFVIWFLQGTHINKFLQACYSNGSHFMSVLKIIQRSPGSHDKVMYMNFFILPAILTKFESKVVVYTW